MGPKISSRVHKIQLLDPITTPYLFMIHFNIILHLRMDLPSDLFLSGFLTKMFYPFLAHLILLHFVK
jgi:hypothetical protein